jgi:hypothetical protein
VVIIRANAQLPAQVAADLINDLHAQAREGIVMVPNYCEVLAVEDGTDLEIIVGKTESERVAELEKELAAAMAYITRTKTCATCKHPPDGTDYSCATCCLCSNWEWRGASGIG